MVEKKFVGNVTHFFSKPSVAVVEVESVLKNGDKISVERGEDMFEQVVSSMQIEHENIMEAKPGQSIGLKTEQPTKEGAKVYKVIE
jgi:translation initiation factor IF-2